MREFKDRLKWARQRWAKAMGEPDLKPTDAAKRLGIPTSTYLGYENGDLNRTPKRPRAMQIAEAYGVRWEWLLEGKGNPTAKVLPVRIIGEVLPGSEVRYHEKASTAAGLELPPGSGIETVAVQVRGASMRGIADDGWLFFFDDVKQPPTDGLIDSLCVLELDDGRVLVKKLQKGRRKNRYDLESATLEPMMRDCRVKWAAKVTWIKPK